MISEIGVDKPLPYSNKSGLPLLKKLENLKIYDYYPCLTDECTQKKLEKFIRLNINPNLKFVAPMPLPKTLLIRDTCGKTGKSALIQRIAHELQLPAYKVRIDTVLSDSDLLTIDNLRRIISFGINSDCVLVFENTNLLNSNCIKSLLFLLHSLRLECIIIVEDSYGESIEPKFLDYFDEVVTMPENVKDYEAKAFFISFLKSVALHNKAKVITSQLIFKNLIPIRDLIIASKEIMTEVLLHHELKISDLKNYPSIRKLLVDA